MKTIGNQFTKKSVVLAVVAVGLLMIPNVKACLSLGLSSASYFSGYSAPSSAGSLLYNCGVDGTVGGTLKSSYNCSFSLNAVNYVGGTTAQGSCFVLECSNGGAYVWNISNWNGTDQINCNFNTSYYGCKNLEVYGNCKTNTNSSNISTVPEPSTVIVGALLLLPFGISTARILFKNRFQLVTG